MTPAELRELMVGVVARGTAKSAFRDTRGRPLLGPVRVAGKTGSLSGVDPKGRYEWFIGVAPAESPREIRKRNAVSERVLASKRRSRYS